MDRRVVIGIVRCVGALIGLAIGSRGEVERLVHSNLEEGGRRGLGMWKGKRWNCG